MSVENLPAIDVHAHFGIWERDMSAVNVGWMSGDPEKVLRRARMANIRMSIVSSLRSLVPRHGGDPLAGNEESERIIPAHDALRWWVVVDPLKPGTYDQAERMLKLPSCVGIKIHPVEHGYPIREHGERIFEFAAARRAIVLSHSGEPECLPEDFVPLADRFPDVRLILAHLGWTLDDDRTHQVVAARASRHGNIFIDTSSAMNIIPGLLEWAVQEIGARRLLFGTDSPLYFTPMQRARIDRAEIGDAEKAMILSGNAAALFHL